MFPPSVGDDRADGAERAVPWNPGVPDGPIAGDVSPRCRSASADHGMRKLHPAKCVKETRWVAGGPEGWLRAIPMAILIAEDQQFHRRAPLLEAVGVGISGRSDKGWGRHAAPTRGGGRPMGWGAVPVRGPVTHAWIPHAPPPEDGRVEVACARGDGSPYSC